MTLQEWSEKYDESARPYTKEGYDPMMLVSDRTRSSDASWDLFHLSDYVVSTVTAGTVWLAIRRIPLAS